MENENDIDTRSRLLTVEVVTDAIIRVLVKKEILSREELQAEILEGAAENEKAETEAKAETEGEDNVSPDGN